MSQEHSIEKYTVNITASRFTDKEALYRNIEQSKEKILEILDEVFSGYFPASADIEIRRIQLDLGLLPREGFTQVMGSRIKQLLATEIEKILVDETFKQHIRENSKTIPFRDPFVLLEKFLDNGFNAELQSQRSFDLDQYILQLLEKDPARLEILFREKINHSKAGKRILRLKAETLRTLHENFPDVFQEVLLKKQGATSLSALPDFILHYLTNPTQAGPMIDTVIEVELRTRWQEKSLNPLIVYQLSLPQLTKLVDMLWRKHPTFKWWTVIRQNASNIPSVWKAEQQLRHLYFIYLGFLHAHQEHTWTQLRFESLLAEGWQDFVEKEEGASKAPEEIEALSRLIFPELSKERAGKKSIFLFPKRTKKTGAFRSELSNLLQYGSPEEIQLYVDYYLEEATTFREWFYNENIRYELLIRVWEHLSPNQLERMLPLLLQEEYKPFRKLLKELLLFLTIELPELSSGQADREILLIVLEILHQSGPASFYETVSKNFILTIWERKLFWSTASIDPVHYPSLHAAVRDPVLATAIFYQTTLPVSIETFQRLLQQRVPEVSGFILSYLSVVNHFLESDRKLLSFLPPGFYKKVYHYLLQQENFFSESDFIHFVNHTLASVFSLDPETIRSGLSEIIIEKPALPYAALLASLLREKEAVEQATVLPGEEIAGTFSSTEELIWQQTIGEENYTIQWNSLRATLFHYVEQEHFPEEIQPGIASRAQFRKTAAVFIRLYRKEFLSLIKEVLKEEKKRLFFISGHGKEMGTFLLKQLSGAQFAELSQWAHEISGFLSFAYPALKPSAIEMLTVKAQWNVLLTNGYIGIVAYLEQLAMLIKQEPERILSAGWEEILLRYQAEKNASSFLALALRHSFIPFFYKEKNNIKEAGAYEIKSLSKQPWQTFINNNPSVEAIRLYFDDPVVWNQNDFREVFGKTSVALPILEKIVAALTEAQSRSLVALIFPGEFLYIREWLKELMLFMHTHYLGAESERVRTKFLARLLAFVQNAKTGVEASVLVARVFNALLREEEKWLDYILRKELYWNETVMYERAPNLSRSMLAKSTVALGMATVTPDYIASLIEKKYPGTAAFVMLYLHVVKEVPLFHFENRDILIYVYKLVYAYLSDEKRMFSSRAFVKEMTAALAAAYSVDQQQAGKAILELVREKTRQGNTRLELVEEILLSLEYESSGFVPESLVISEMEIRSAEEKLIQERLIEEKRKQENTSDSSSEGGQPASFFYTESPGWPASAFPSLVNQVIDPEEIIRLLEHKFPSQAEFIVLYKTVLEQSSLPVFLTKEQRQEWYLLLYDFLDKNKNSFSPALLVSQVNSWMASRYSIKLESLVDALLASVQNQIRNGFSGYGMIKKILQEQEGNTYENRPTLSFEITETDIKRISEKIRKDMATKGPVFIDLAEVKQFVEQRHPSHAGFVSLYMKAAELSSLALVDTESRKQEMYIYLYNYLEHKKGNFSASDFVKEITARLSVLRSIDQKTIGLALLESSEAQVQKGNVSFESLKELLAAQGYEESSFSAAAPLLYLSEEEKEAIRTELLRSASAYDTSSQYAEALWMRIEKKFPALSGFVSLYMKAAELSSLALVDTESRKQEVYTYLYNYLEHKKENFSASDFVKEITARLSVLSSIDQKTIGLALLKSSEAQVQKGNVPFESLKELLAAQGYEESSFSAEAPLLYLSEEEKEAILRSASLDLDMPSHHTEEIRNVMLKQFPGFMGFVFLYIEAFEKMRHIFSFVKEKQADLYLTIYVYLVKYEANFSSVAFVKELTAQLATVYALDQKKLGQELLRITINEIQDGNTRFEILKEILQTQGYEAETFVSSLVPAITGVESQAAKKEIRKISKQIRFELFRKAVGHFIQQGTISDLGALPSEGSVGFTDYLKAFFYEYKGTLLPLLKEILQGEQAQKQLAGHKDELLKALVLEELSGNRSHELLEWNHALEAFLLDTYPSIDSAKLQVSLYQSLLALLLQRDRITVGLFSWLEEAFRLFKKVHYIEPGAELIEAIEQYKQKGLGHSLLLKALERIELLAAQKERRTILDKIVKGKFTEEEAPVVLEGRIPVHNAGMVLAGPFLYRYFDRLGIVENQQFKTPELACRAAQLLQFLATGSTEMQEQDLLLNKVLCGVPLDTVLDPFFEITEEEKEISESLLRGILANWEKLKTNDIDSLRQGFLVREGWLEKTELGWELEVERKTMDILVDLIPWSFTLIKLGWMEASLTTKWKKSLGE